MILWIGFDPTQCACAHDMSNRLRPIAIHCTPQHFSSTSLFQPKSRLLPITVPSGPSVQSAIFAEDCIVQASQPFFNYGTLSWNGRQTAHCIYDTAYFIYPIYMM